MISLTQAFVNPAMKYLDLGGRWMDKNREKACALLESKEEADMAKADEL